MDHLIHKAGFESGFAHMATMSPSFATLAPHHVTVSLFTTSSSPPTHHSHKRTLPHPFILPHSSGWRDSGFLPWCSGGGCGARPQVKYFSYFNFDKYLTLASTYRADKKLDLRKIQGWATHDAYASSSPSPMWFIKENRFNNKTSFINFMKLSFQEV